MPEAFVDLPEAERIALTLGAKGQGVPLTERWRQLDVTVSEEWIYRSRAAVKWLKDAPSVADLGCGQMLLETCLRPGQTYVPVDFLRRDDRTVVVDFNTQPLPPLGATHFAALGLFEYLYDLEGFLKSLRENFQAGVASFFARRPRGSQEQRLAAGWVNHQTRSEILDLLGTVGFTVSRRFQISPSHFLFRLD